jgi:hypothetical protein
MSERSSGIELVVKLIVCLFWSLSVTAVTSAEPEPQGITTEQLDFFEKQVRPLLVKRCYACHAGTKAGGGLSWETARGWQRGGESGPAIVPGKPDASLLIDAIQYRTLQMPPADQGGKLPDQEIAILTRWVEIGAPDPRRGGEKLGGMTRQTAQAWWAFQPLPASSGPDESSNRRPETQSAHRSVIDRLLDEKIQPLALPTTPPADKRTLIRRATYDLTGLPPTAAEVEAFLADQTPDAFAKVIERLLSSPQYGVHWGRHWLDVVRYADTAGENTDRPLPHAWKYRNWVFQAMQADMPYDQFVRLQLAGDLLATNDPEPMRSEGIIATGYLAIARRFGHDIDKDMHLTLEDVIDNLGKNLLGLSLGCARCHDHKYDPVSADDYYALYGIFASSRFSFPGCEPKGQPRDLVPLIDPVQAETLQANYRRELGEFEKRVNAAPAAATRLQPQLSHVSHLLAEATVGEGQAVQLSAVATKRVEPSAAAGNSNKQAREENRNASEADRRSLAATAENAPDTHSSLERLSMQKGQVLLLTVFPNGNHGADTTRVDLQIQRQDAATPRIWSTADLIDRLAVGPAIEHQAATWCLLDVTNGPLFLHERKRAIEGKPELHGWSLGDTPSSIVNASREPVRVWTTLPPRSFFVHPGKGRNVAVAWVCPEDGIYQIRGEVADAHPAGLDGVRFRLETLASLELGPELIQLGKSASELPTRPQPPAFPVAYAVVEDKPQNSKRHERGDPEQLGDEIPRGWLTVFGGERVSATSGSGRRPLADWVTQQPLFARVMANRIWQWHFGQGLVRSPNDFGSRGEPATHPVLLDWLAAQFVSNGYRIKSMHRIIMLSEAYQRASATPSIKDPENRFWAHFLRRRLTAEELRDSLLQASGQLDLSPAESHPFPAEATWNFSQHNPFNAVYETNHRSAFLMVQRQRRHPFLSLFDGADPNASTASRQTTTVPSQALYFINDPFFHQQANALASLLVQEEPDRARIERLYKMLFQREPSPNEVAQAREFSESYPAEPREKWAAYARVLMASNEFLYLD